jgi:hypothetical protein
MSNSTSLQAYSSPLQHNATRTWSDLPIELIQSICQYTGETIHYPQKLSDFFCYKKNDLNRTPFIALPLSFTPSSTESVEKILKRFGHVSAHYIMDMSHIIYGSRTVFKSLVLPAKGQWTLYYEEANPGVMFFMMPFCAFNIQIHIEYLYISLYHIEKEEPYNTITLATPCIRAVEKLFLGNALKQEEYEMLHDIPTRHLCLVEMNKETIAFINHLKPQTLEIKDMIIEDTSVLDEWVQSQETSQLPLKRFVFNPRIDHDYVNDVYLPHLNKKQHYKPKNSKKKTNNTDKKKHNPLGFILSLLVQNKNIKELILRFEMPDKLPSDITQDKQLCNVWKQLNHVELHTSSCTQGLDTKCWILANVTGTFSMSFGDCVTIEPESCMFCHDYNIKCSYVMDRLADALYKTSAKNVTLDCCCLKKGILDSLNKVISAPQVKHANLYYYPTKFSLDRKGDTMYGTEGLKQYVYWHCERKKIVSLNCKQSGGYTTIHYMCKVQ